MDKYTFDPASAWPTATAAVAGFIGKRYAGVFTAQDIEDIISSVVTDMWQYRESFDPTRNLFSWTWRIAQNDVIDAVTYKNRRLAISGDIERVNGTVYTLPTPEYADDNLIRSQVEEQFLDVIKSAREKRILHYLLDGLSNQEIAQREDITVSAATMAVFHLRQRLKQRAIGA